LANGAYIVRIEAVDAGLNQSSVERTVNVSGNLKLGNFSLSFTDLEVPVAGVPITVTRSYDSLDADRQGDFGYGWKLDLSDTKVTIDRGGSQETGLFGYAPFVDGDRLVITLPDGTTEGFTFYGEQSIQGGYIQTADYLPKFMPDPGVKSQLLVDPRWIRKLGDGYIDMETGRDYTPVDPVLGGGYTLRLRNGSELAIDAQTGELSSITDTSGNTLTFTGMGIESSSGRGIEFERDQAGRITAVIDFLALPER
jgi:hypothetical protein